MCELTSKLIPTLKLGQLQDGINFKAGTNLNVWTDDKAGTNVKAGTYFTDGTNFKYDTNFKDGTNLKA